MTDSMLPEPRKVLSLGAIVLACVGAAGLVAGGLATRSCAAPTLPVIPPISSSITIVRPTPDVLVAVKDMARLESTSFHMERVIDLSDKQSQLFGLLQTEDAILLVAVADVSAGVDLQKLSTNDVSADPVAKTAKIVLPGPEVFHAELDNGRTYVHTRRTGALARRQENLETRARQEAERTLVSAAVQAGLLSRAGEDARRAVEGVVRALGYDHVEVTVRAPNSSAQPAPSAPAQ